jgi:glycerophosphoryl diester phosphodiesterase
LVRTLTEQPQKGVLLAARQVLSAFRLNWKLFLGIHIGINAFSLLVLTPLVTLVMGWLILASGHTALTDEDILFFVLSPAGMLVMLLAGALYTTVVVFQQAAMITAGHFVATGQAVSIPRLGRYLLVKFWPLFRLALHMVARTALIVAPFLGISALAYYFFLTEFDINYYLTARPPVFWWAGGFILLCHLTLAGVLLRMFSGWVLALPMLLLNSENPARVLSFSRKASISRRVPIAMTLLALFLINTGLLGIVSLLADFGVDGAVSLAGDSLRVMAYLLGGLLVFWLLANLAITFFTNSVLSLVIIYFFVHLVHISEDNKLDSLLAPSRGGRTWHVSGAIVAGLALVISLAAGLALNIMIDRLNIEDKTMIIAHRGASADAPENTLAALELAISDGADWVEIDVQETLEGEVVVIHDSDLKKIGGSSLKVFEASLADLQNVDIGSWKNPSFSDQRVPTLQQVLALCKDRINIVIELKYYGREEHLEERVARLVEAADMQESIVIMSLSYPGVQKMKSLRPDWTVGLLSSVAIGDITRLEADFFAVNATFTSRAFIKHVQSRNRQVMVWTVNDPVSMSAMMSKGVDGIITDKPALAAMIRTERAELGTHERIMIQLASFIGKQPERPEQ